MLGRVRRVLLSPRRRRRLAWVSAIGAAAGCALAIGLLYPNTGERAAPLGPGTPKIVHQEAPSRPLPRSDRRASEKILDAFVVTAVLRQNLDRSYDLVTVHFRAGLHRRDWRTGDIPVVPFPRKDFGLARSKLSYSHGNVARYEVAVMSRPNGTTGSMLFSAELHAVGAGTQRRWLIDYWEPIGGGIGTPSEPSNPLSVSRVDRGPAVRAPLGATWVLVPLSILSLIVLIPAALAIRGWRRNRRADRDYAKTLPPLRPPTA
jgi:hypothetical protein